MKKKRKKVEFSVFGEEKEDYLAQSSIKGSSFLRAKE